MLEKMVLVEDGNLHKRSGAMPLGSVDTSAATAGMAAVAAGIETLSGRDGRPQQLKTY